MRKLIVTTFMVAVVAMTGMGQAAPAAAQVATVTFVEGVVEHQTLGTNVYQRTRVGSKLNTGDRIRTGKRSRAEIRYSGDNYVRLSQLGDFVITGANEGVLHKGSLRAQFPKGQGGGRVRGGSTVANVAGSSFVMTVTPLGAGLAAVDVLWTEGSGTLFTPQGRLDLRAGQGIRFTQPVPPEGTTPGDIVSGSPDQSAPGGQPQSAPPPNLVDLTVDPGLGSTISGGQVNNQAGSGQQIIQRTDNINIQSNVANATQPEASEVAIPLPQPRIRLRPPPPLPHFDRRRERQRSRRDSSLISHPLSLAKRMGVAPPPLTGPPVEGMQPSYFAPRFDGNLFLFKGRGSSRAVSVRLREHGVVGGVFWEFALTPTNFFSFQDHQGHTRIDLTDARIVIRNDRWGEFSIGRQRFLKGPVQNTVIGTLMRQGGRDIQDAILWSPRLGDSRFDLDLAYVVDAFPAGLPTAIAGLQGGYYTRLQYQSNYGTFGVSAVRHELGEQTGTSFDFAVPLIRQELDFYGELGRDTQARNIRTVGLYFPGLFQRYDIDLFIEYTRLRDFGMANQYLLRLYKKINSRFSLVVAADKSGGQKILVGAGLAIALK